MNKENFGLCPLCYGEKNETVLSLECGNFDNSSLYPVVNVIYCKSCGHLFNLLSEDDLKGLNLYYEKEYAPANLNAGVLSGDRPGSESEFTSIRYSQLYALIERYVKPHHKILDVGCAMGGFLYYLEKKGFTQLFGVDATELYVKNARCKSNFTIKLGTAEALPFDDNTMDVIVIEQVLEHLAIPGKAFREAKRVLKKDGILCIGVPDAAKYIDYHFFDYYWFLLREHIQHFDLFHLNFLGMREGFKLLCSKQTAHAVMSDKMIMPNLAAVFSAGEINRNVVSTEDRWGLKQKITEYKRVEDVHRKQKLEIVDKMQQAANPLFIWGVGREFLYLFESVGLKNCNILGLIDLNKFKQEKCTVNGMSISDCKDFLKNTTPDTTLIITAVAHEQSIREMALTHGFRGEILEAKTLMG